MAKALGKKWFDALVRADHARDWWRTIVWQSREHYDGVSVRGVGQPVPYNKHRAAEDNVRAALQPDTVAVRLRALFPEDASKKRAAQVYINWALRASRFTATTNPYITHARTDGCGIYKIEFGSSWQPRIAAEDEGNRAIPGNPTERSRTDREQAQTDWLAQAFPSELQNRPVPVPTVVDPMDFLMDGEAVTLDTSAFVAHRVWMPKRMIDAGVKSGHFKNVALSYDPALPSTQERTQRIRARAAHATAATARTAGRRRRRNREVVEDDEIWEVWEIHDRVEGRVITIVPGTNAPLRNVPAEIAGMPYVDYRPSATPFTYWAIPDVFQYLPAQQVLDTLLSHMVDHVSRHAKSLGFTEQTLSEDQVVAIGEAVNGEIIQGVDADDVKFANIGQLHPDNLQLFGMLSQIIHEISGISQMAVGVPAGQRTTATEVTQITQFQSLRMRRMAIDLNESFLQVAQRYLLLLRLFAKPETTVSVLDKDALEFEEDAREQFLTVQRDQLAADFDFEIMVGAGAEIQGNVEKKQSLDMYALLRQDPEIEGRALVENVLLAHELRPDSVMTERPEAAQLSGILGPDGQPLAASGARAPVAAGRGRGAAEVRPTNGLSADRANGRAGQPDLASLLSQAIGGQRSR